MTRRVGVMQASMPDVYSTAGLATRPYRMSFETPWRRELAPPSTVPENKPESTHENFTRRKYAHPFAKLR